MLHTDRPLIDRFDAPSLREHWQHSPAGENPHPDTCDYCLTGPMLEEIHAVWSSGNDAACEVIWALSDGYGEPGYVPEQGYDWSGIRDSTPAAMRAMWEAIHG